MTNTKPQGAARNVAPIRLGRNIVSCSIEDSNDEHLFTVHEDLICASSKYFKEALQKVRQPVEGECPICRGELDPRKSDIAFCRDYCGQNIHEKCIQQWIRAHDHFVKCPMCRDGWNTAREQSIQLSSVLDSDALQLYISWLYTGQLHIDGAIDRASDEYNIALLDAWIVLEVLGDLGFRRAIITEHFSLVEAKVNEGFGADAIRYAYEEESSTAMKAFVVDSFYINAPGTDLDHFKANIGAFPIRFVRELCIVARRLRQGVEPLTRQEALEEWLAYTEDHP